MTLHSGLTSSSSSPSLDTIIIDLIVILITWKTGAAALTCILVDNIHMRTFLPAHPVKKPSGPGSKTRPTGDTANAPGSPLCGAAGVIGSPVRRCRGVECRVARAGGQIGGAHLLLDQLMVATSPARLHRLPVDWLTYSPCFCISVELWNKTNLPPVLPPPHGNSFAARHRAAAPLTPGGKTTARLWGVLNLRLGHINVRFMSGSSQVPVVRYEIDLLGLVEHQGLRLFRVAAGFLVLPQLLYGERGKGAQGSACRLVERGHWVVWVSARDSLYWPEK